MVIQWIVCLLCGSVSCYAGPMQTAQKEGQALAKNGSSQAIQQVKQLDVNDFTAKSIKNGHFDPRKSLIDVESRSQPYSEAVDFLSSGEVRRNERENKNFHTEEIFFKRSEEITSQAIDKREDKISIIENNEFSIKTCRQAGEPFIITVERTLNVDHQPEEKIKLCLGHEKIIKVKKIGLFEESILPYKQKLKADSTIQSYEIDLLHSIRSFFIVRIKWIHVDNADGCDHCSDKKIKETVDQQEEKWTFDNPELWELSKSPDSTIVEQICLDKVPKKINGKQISKQCRKERISFLYHFPCIHECDFLREQLCEQVDQKCIQSSPFGCAMWEVTFKCLNQITRQTFSIDEDGIYGIDPSLWQVDYKPNRSFAEVAAKLAVFEEAKKELEKSNVIDASSLEIFKGKKMTCSKSVAENVLYDCCFSYGGVAKKMGLSKCSADELSLGEMREEGLCHYVGSYDEKILNTWKSREEHVFCCYPSKIARLVQEEGRKQIGIEWGKPKEPNCGGFTFDQLALVDFSKMDLSEICDQMPTKFPEDFQDKMQAFQNRLEDQIQKEEQVQQEKQH